MKKAGIISLYHKNKNYGGLLQAYALTRYVRNLGYDAEQICFEQKNIEPCRLTSRELCAKAVKNFIERTKWKMEKPFVKNIQAQLDLRVKAFDEFEKTIPHSEKIYTRENIADCAGEYDIFISGSDQVWNFSWYNPEYFLSFVPQNARKISYAASMPTPKLPEKKKRILYNHLIRFDEISVREKEPVPYIDSLLGRGGTVHVLDPTLLLTREDWDEICAERLIEEKYIFCCFLGKDGRLRKTASDFAKKLNLKLVALPHLCNINFSDMHFSAEALYDVSPEKFISLIRHSEYVLTDSFHAAVFSHIYNTKYFVFPRNESGGIPSRLTTLLELLNSKERFCLEKKPLKYLMKLKDLPLPAALPGLSEARERSREFLKRNLEALL